MKEYQIRVQVIATADDDGANAANVTAGDIAGRLTTVNQIFAPAKVKFVFDEANGFLKVNSTLLNRDFTLLEQPNVGGEKWDHEPLRDEESHGRARTELARQFPDELVLFFRRRKKIKEEDEDGTKTGFWIVANKGGGSSSANAFYVNMSTSSGARDLAHEIGHYLQLPHTFVSGATTVAKAASKIKNYVEAGHPKSEGLDALDGDRNVVLDTPGDCKGGIFVSEELEPCGAVGEIKIPVTFADNTSMTYTLAPDRSLVMSYFKGCPGDKTISPQQARRVRDALELRHRNNLISVAPAFSHRIARLADADAGAIIELDMAPVRAGRVVTAVSVGAGELKLIVWDVSESDGKITRRGSASAGLVSRVALCSLGMNMVATAVCDAEDRLKVILWRVRENGEITRLQSASAEGQAIDVAAATARYNLNNNFFATAVRQPTAAGATLKLDVWEAFADGSIAHRASAAGGKINVPQSGLSTPRITLSHVGSRSVVTHVRDEDNDLKAILWQFEGGSLTRGGSSVLGAPGVGAISACGVSREIAVAAVQDKNKKLKLVAYGFPEDGGVIARGRCSFEPARGAEGMIRLGPTKDQDHRRDAQSDHPAGAGQCVRHLVRRLRRGDTGRHGRDGRARLLRYTARDLPFGRSRPPAL